MAASPFETMASLQLELFLFVITGIVLTKTGIISAQGRKSLSDVLIHFILPCNIICSFQLDVTAQLITSCSAVLIIACATQLLFLVVSKYLYPYAQKGHLSCLRYATICSNAGFLGLPLIGGVFGAMGTLLTSIALIPQRIVMWSAGLSLFTQTDGKTVLRKLATHPCILSVLIGFFLMLAGNPTLPGFIQNALSSASGTTTCLSMIVIGSILASAEHINFRDKEMWWFTLVRLVLIPLAVYLALTLLGVDKTVRGVMVLVCGMPAGSTMAILAARYGGDAPFASCLVFISTLLSLFSLPLLCLIL